MCHASRRYAEAAEHFGLSIGLFARRAGEATGTRSGSAAAPAAPVTTYNARGQSYLSARRLPEAERDFDEVIRRRPDYLDGYVNRAQAREFQADYAGALDDLDHVLAKVPGRTDVLFQRARVRRLAGDAVGSAADRAGGLRSTPATRAGGPAGRSRTSWPHRPAAGWAGPPTPTAPRRPGRRGRGPRPGGGLGGRPGDSGQRPVRAARAAGGGIATLDRLLANYPEQVPQRAGRAVLLARAGKDADALADARQVVAAAESEGDTLALYQVAGAYALLSQRDRQHRKTAELDLMSRALRLDPTLIRVTFYDPELRPFDGDREFAQLRDAAAVLARPKD